MQQEQIAGKNIFSRNSTTCVYCIQKMLIFKIQIKDFDDTDDHFAPEPDQQPKSLNSFVGTVETLRRRLRVGTSKVGDDQSATRSKGEIIRKKQEDSLK